MRHDRLGTHGLGRLGDSGPIRLVLTERELRPGSDPSVDELRAALNDVYGTNFGLGHVHWTSRFTDMSRQAVSYRQGRVLLAGDAAHVHPPHGGQGLNTGIQDAVNLGWKLAQVVTGTSPATLLDTYHDERHPVGARVLRTTMAQVALGRPDDRQQAVRETITELLQLEGPRRTITARLAALDVHYPDGGDAHPLVGRRMPDLDLGTVDGSMRVFTVLHDAHAILVDLSASGEFDLTPWATRVRRIDATYEGAWELPVIGEVPAPPAVLIRPDGHVAWVGELSGPELADVLTRWFGDPAAATGDEQSAQYVRASLIPGG